MKNFVAETVYDGYARLVQLCGSLPAGKAIRERHDPLRHPSTTDWRKKVLRIRAYFENEIECFIYKRLPGVVENSLQRTIICRVRILPLKRRI